MEIVPSYMREGEKRTRTNFRSE